MFELRGMEFFFLNVKIHGESTLDFTAVLA